MLEDEDFDCLAALEAEQKKSEEPARKRYRKDDRFRKWMESLLPATRRISLRQVAFGVERNDPKIRRGKLFPVQNYVATFLTPDLLELRTDKNITFFITPGDVLSRNIVSNCGDFVLIVSQEPSSQVVVVEE